MWSPESWAGAGTCPFMDKLLDQIELLLKGLPACTKDIETKPMDVRSRGLSLRGAKATKQSHAQAKIASLRSQ